MVRKICYVFSLATQEICYSYMPFLFSSFFLCVFKILYYDQSTKPVPSQLAFFWIQNTGNEQYTALQL